ncbi:MAG: terminase family protein [Clostridia bacterium]|nr:terminase family protein [Clostridia bacterium]
MKKLIPDMINDDLDYDQTYMRNKRLPRADAQFNFTPEMIAEIEKCKNDILYFSQHYFHIVTLDEGKRKIQLYTGQKRILKALQKYRFNVINASRQSGKTTLTTIYALWMTCFSDFKRVVIVANKESTAIMILRRIALAYEELPNWLKPGTAQYGKKEIILGNHSSIAISTTTGSAVRGDTVNCIIIDEAAHIEDHLMKDFWASVIPVISSSKKRTTKIFMTSTPKGTGNLFYDIFTKAKVKEDDNNLTWHAEEFHWFEIPGRGKLWKQDMIEALHGDKLLFEQEFNCAFLETGDSAIDIDLLNSMENECREPIQVFEDGHYKVWHEPKPDHIYGMGIDVGEGIGKAASVVQVLDFTDLTDIHQVAVYANRFIHPTRFADIINRIGHHFGCPPALIERNNIGSEVIAVLKEIHGYANIVSYNPEKLAYGDIRPGVLSHTNTKFNGVMNMRYWLNAARVVKIYDMATIQELKTFVRYPNGTWKKKQGDNVWDDRVMSLVWCLFILNDNVAERYYDIVETDDNGKPLKLAAYIIQQPGIFKLDPFFQQTPNAPLPSFFNMTPNNDINELARSGWQKLQ